MLGARDRGLHVTGWPRSGKAGTPDVEITLDGAAAARVHIDRGALVVADDLGRVEVVDLAKRALRLSARMRV